MSGRKLLLTAVNIGILFFFVFQSVVNDLLCLFLPKALFSCIFSRHTGYVCLLYALA